MGKKTLLPFEKRVKAVTKVGLDIQDTKAWFKKYRGVVRNAKCRDIECPLTFLQYMKLVVKAGLTQPSDIGMAVHQYNLGRIGDEGPYEWGNCRFITSKQNRRERVTNGCFEAMAAAKKGKQSPALAKLAKIRRGKTKYNDETIAKISKANSKRFRLVSPKGKVYIGDSLAEFCASKDLSYNSMAAVCSGRLPSIKGWTGSYMSK
jgi:hypothetical protein